ncbi:MAG TPA: DUF1848 domain-containing protein [Alphaproteobacteria bacterium]|nr:DUF1848 domain-containing protein [Alphaproteobacteria bacterium]
MRKRYILPKMIISASYKTDIPAFYGRWFMARLEAGFCRMVNPYGGQVYEVPLTRGAVDGFVFWTRNPGPFGEALSELRRRGFPFILQLTITGYPRALESSVIERHRSIELAQTLAREFGAKRVVWRYDPILATSLTPLEWHSANFAELAQGLAGAVDEVVISFAQIYRKTRRNLDRSASGFRFAWHDPDDDAKRALARELAARAREHGMRLSLCAQPQLKGEGVGEARCIDAERLSAVAGHEIEAPTKGNRPGCLCAESRDIGDYDSCPHGCVYCYAVATRSRARRRHQAHDPAGEFLSPPACG